MIFLELTCKNKTYLINTDEIVDIALDHDAKNITITCKSESFVLEGNEDFLDNEYLKLKLVLKKAFMIVQADLSEDLEKHIDESLPKVAKSLPELDKCILITEDAQQQA